MVIKLKQENTKGAAFIEDNDKVLAEMTYSIASPNLIIIDHTEVDSSLKGKGIGKKLLMELVDKARKENIKIIPLCPFAKSVFDKDANLRDVLK
ncbi:MAG: putative GNAT family acetyltransferase [Crocinitomix sp.]|jgi:predicted GNAT family acetyltransferase